MSNITTNPWSFRSGDVVTTAVATLTLNADGTVTAVVGATAAFAAGNFVTIADNTSVGGVYNWFYQILVVVNGTTLTLVPSFQAPPHIPAGTGAGGATGSLSLSQYHDWVRVEDISWQNPSAAGQFLDIRDRNGNIIWQATATGAGSQNRGKVFWVNGITLLTLQSGVALLTVN